MAAISSLFRRLGYVKLDDYGLLVTSDDRVLSTRSDVLDDGLGGKIVGWKEGDLAAMELTRWEPLRPATGRATAKPPAVPPPLPRAAATIAPISRRPPTAPVPIAAPPIAIFAPTPAPIVTRPAPVIIAPAAPVVAAAPVACEDDDEWEWEIAVARARAAAEWAEEAAAAIATAAVKPTARAPRPQRITAPIAVVAAPKSDPLKADAWPKTEELASWDTTTPAPSKVEHVVRVLPRLPMQSTKPVPVLATAPARTVIPVPPLARVTDPNLVRPVVSPRPPIVTQVPKRYPRATGRVDDTIRTHAAVPANDDKTSPNIALPPAGAGKRVAAKQR